MGAKLLLKKPSIELASMELLNNLQIHKELSRKHEQTVRDNKRDKQQHFNDI